MTPNSNVDVILFGAGVSALLAAETLRDRGLRVVVLEKERRVGGRQRWDETSNQQVVESGLGISAVQEQRPAERAQKERQVNVQ